MMALVPAPVCTTPVSSLILLPQTRARSGRSFACHRSPSPPPSSSPHSQGDSTSAEPPHSLASSAPLLESKTAHSAPAFTYKLSADRTADSVVRLDPSAESAVERVIFDFRFLALLAVGGSLAGSLLCFLNGCVYIVDAYRVYWTSCIRGLHTGQMVLRLVEAIDVYLAGTVMLIFGMGLYGLFISNVNPEVPSTVDRALKGSSLFGMFALKVAGQDFWQELHLESYECFQNLSRQWRTCSQCLPLHCFWKGRNGCKSAHLTS
ncbi:uncharacterized protein LOC109724156 isoform X2 [Ananas comosus]|uniref:Uncharacterized protein LOC109724156 isoform X2 n=1 Tax=Ananas comosus TaxID=4615 RepID=A0A6P5GSL5_ANACO|nr:uncharacterized protein LOC109724156 isoform X2 [Ananas comosus]